MTLHVLDTVWRHYPEGGSKLIVMLALADYAGRDDGTQIWPSINKLAAKCRMSRRQVIRILKDLVGPPDDPGEFLELVTRANLGGARRSNHYRIRVDRLKALPDLTLERVTNCHRSEPAGPVDNPPISPVDNSQKGDIFDPKGDIPGTKRVTSEAQKGDIAMSPKPKEPNITQREPAPPVDNFQPINQTGLDWGPPPESREQTLRKYIAHLKRVPPATRDVRELERANAELDELLLRRGRS